MGIQISGRPLKQIPFLSPTLRDFNSIICDRLGYCVSPDGFDVQTESRINREVITLQQDPR
jgi:hypothetical protein